MHHRCRGRIRDLLSRRVVWLLAPLTFVIVGLGAAPASAIIVRLANGKEISYEAMAGSRAARFSAFFSNLDYSGGPVMPSNTNYTVVWTPSNYGAHTPFQSTYVRGVNQFFTDLAADSGTAANSDSVATQYNDASGHVAAYNSSFGRTYTDTDPLPTNGCPALSGHVCLTDAQLQSELSSFLASQGAPRDLTHDYFLLTPPDVASCFDAAGTTCSGNADQGRAFCAYHSASTKSPSFLYANIPDTAGLGGCDPFATFCPRGSRCVYDNGPADGVLSAISHEHIESITDPQPNNAWTDWQQCGAGAPTTCGGEIGDKCNNDAFNDPLTHLQTDRSGNDTPYNYVINTHHYLLQREWSNQGHACAHNLTFSPNTASASYTVTPTTGDNVNFDASSSHATGGVAEYVWQFNDGPGGTQANTVQTTSPTISHVFPSAGAYVVALTVMGPDGTSNGSAHLVFAVASPPSAAFSSPSAVAGVAAPFNGSSSSDPNPGGTITSYSWSFGDRGSASGPVTSHAFPHRGLYTVTLTVTDNFSVSSSVSHTVAVAAESPSASFSPPEGLAHTPIHFRGSGHDRHGSIRSYRWSFGDGGKGSGPDPSHRYARPGAYRVTLTVTDSRGKTVSTSRVVIIGPSRRVPNVKGKSLAKARRALRAIGCRVGHIRSPGSHHRGQLVVVRESPGAGTVVPVGKGVALTLANR